MKSFDWTYFLKTDVGNALINEEIRVLDSIWPRLSGQYLLILGNLMDQLKLVERCRLISRLWITENDNILTTHPSHLSAKLLKSVQHIRADYRALPIIPNSMDAILLPHVLESEASSEDILQEVEIALKPEGSLVILGLNPISLLGCRIALASNSKNTIESEKPRFKNMSQWCDWLGKRNFEVYWKRKLFYRPPINHSKWLSKLTWLERIGSILCPWFGGAYVLLARKRLFGITPLRAKWKKMPKWVRQRYAEPAKRSGAI
jgi:hypothetical protein